MDSATCLALAAAAAVLLSATEAVASRGNNTGLADSSQPIDSALSLPTTTPTFDPSVVASNRTEEEMQKRVSQGGGVSRLDPQWEQTNKTNQAGIVSTEEPSVARTQPDQGVLATNGPRLLFFVKVRRNMTQFLRYFNSTFIRFDAPEDEKVHEIFEKGPMTMSANKSAFMGDGGGPLRLQFVLKGNSQSHSTIENQLSSSSPVQYTDDDIDVVRLFQDSKHTEESRQSNGSNAEIKPAIISTAAVPVTTAGTTKTTTVTTTAGPALPRVVYSFMGLPVVPQRRLDPLPIAGLNGQRVKRSLRTVSRRRRKREAFVRGLPSWSRIRGHLDDVPSSPVVRLQEIGKVDIRGLPSEEEIYHRMPGARKNHAADETGVKIEPTRTDRLPPLAKPTGSIAPLDAPSAHTGSNNRTRPVNIATVTDAANQNSEVPKRPAGATTNTTSLGSTTTKLKPDGVVQNDSIKVA